MFFKKGYQHIHFVKNRIQFDSDVEYKKYKEKVLEIFYNKNQFANIKLSNLFGFCDLTPSRVAKMIGINVTTADRWIYHTNAMGYAVPDPETLIDLADLLGFDRDMYLALVSMYYTPNRIEKLKKIIA